MAQFQIVDGRSAFNAPKVFKGVTGPIYDPLLPTVAAPAATDPADRPPAAVLGAVVPAVAPLTAPEATTLNDPVCVAPAFCVLNGAGRYNARKVWE